MNEESLYSSSNLDHLGLVAGMVDELGLVELIDGNDSLPPSILLKLSFPSVNVLDLKT